MASSNVPVCDEVLAGFKKVKTDKTISGIVIKFNKDLTKLIMGGEIEKGPGALGEFKKKALDGKEACYGVLDLFSENDDTSTGTTSSNKIILVCWIGSTLTIKQKMLAASSKNGLISKLTGVTKHHTINEVSEFEDVDEFLSRMGKMQNATKFDGRPIKKSVNKTKKYDFCD